MNNVKKYSGIVLLTLPIHGKNSRQQLCNESWKYFLWYLSNSIYGKSNYDEVVIVDIDENIGEIGHFMEKRCFCKTNW